jgi:mycothiol synthase
MPPLPELDDVTFRAFQGVDDYPHFVRIINVSARAEDEERVETVEGITSAYEHLERCDPRHDLLVAEAAGAPVAYSRVWWDDEAGGPRVHKFFGLVDPEYRGRGIGRALLAWNEQRLREIAATQEHVGERLLETWVNDRNGEATALLQAHGYEPATYSAEMLRPTVDDLPDHPLPDGLEIRPVRDEDLRTIWEADTDAFRDHWGYVEQTEAGFERFLAQPYTDPTLWKVAWDDEEVAGQVRSFVDTAQNAEFGRERGWTENISTARRWRRRGVAKALIVESIRELAARGMTEVALGVHTENPNGAYDLYAGLGYEVVGTWTTYRKPL